MLLPKKDSDLSKADENMTVLVLLMMQPQNPSLHGLPVSRY